MRAPIDFKTIGDRVAVIVQPHPNGGTYELEIARAEWLLADLSHALHVAKVWAAESVR